MEKLNHTNWHSSQPLVHGNDVTMHKRHLEKFAISVTPPQIKQRRLGERSFQINIELIISFEFRGGFCIGELDAQFSSTTWRELLY